MPTANLEDFRKDLRRSINCRRESFTTKEFKFLTDIALEGNQQEVNLAIKKLTDTDLFFDIPRKQRDECSQSLKLNGLKTRRKSALHNDIWKAHEKAKAMKRTSKKKDFSVGTRFLYYQNMV